MRNRAASPLAVLLTAALGAPAAALYPAAPVSPSTPRPLAPVVVDAGHGGKDLGAVVKRTYEKDIALDIARRLRDRLAKSEVPVVMTRDSDELVTLDRRLVRAVDDAGSLFVSVHINAERNPKRSGIVVYTYGPELRKAWRPLAHPSVPPMPAPPRSLAEDSARLAKAFAAALRADGHRVELNKADYYVLKNPTQPSLLLELGHLSNPEERERLLDPAYREKLAATLAKVVESGRAERVLRRSVAKD